MIEFLLILIGALLAATIGASVEYYRQIRKAQKEYEKAKVAIEDIVVSFNRELKREATRLELVAYKVEGSSYRADTALKKADTVEKKLSPLESQLSVFSENNAKALSKLSEIDMKVHNIETSCMHACMHETLKAKVTWLEEQVQKLLTIPEVRSEPVIPIKRDKAMATLTDTELSVLEMLSIEGPKTAPEIKEKVQLSREHTARLMKKLYEEGYLERETGKIPFKYSIKKEMGKLLKKTEPPQT